MEGRRIHGEGLDHEQDYVRERIEQAGDTDELAAASERLQQELQDLGASGEAQQTQSSDIDVGALQTQAVTPVEQGELRQAGSLDAAQQGAVDPDQLPPTAEARSRIDAGGGGYGNL